MPLPRPRSTVRRLMILVAVVAVGFAAHRMGRRRQFHLEKAEEHAQFSRLVTRTPEDIAYWEARWTGQRSGRGPRYPWPAGAPFVPAIVRYHDDVAAQYRRAARTPWVAIAPEAPGM